VLRVQGIGRVAAIGQVAGFIEVEGRPSMAFTPEHLDRRRRTNIWVFKVFSIINLALALLFLAIDISTLWWLALLLLLVGAFMGMAWFPRFTRRT
jgi:hypothetical protein